MAAAIARGGVPVVPARGGEAERSTPPGCSASSHPDEARGVVAAPEQLYAWAEQAAPGARFAYATRAYLPIGASGAAAVRELAARGLVHPTQKRIAPGEFTYFAERSSAPWPLAAAPRERLAAVRREVDATCSNLATDCLLPVLARAARFGRPCPTDKQLAEKARIRPDEVQPCLDALRSLNLVRVFAAPAPTLRYVVIVETGHRTGLVA